MLSRAEEDIDDGTDREIDEQYAVIESLERLLAGTEPAVRRLYLRMRHEVAGNLGGMLPGGGFVLDGDRCWDPAAEQNEWLRKLRRRYGKELLVISGRRVFRCLPSYAALKRRTAARRLS